MSRSGPARPAVFLDRDGTLIEEHRYLDDPDGVELVSGAAASIRRLSAAGYPVVVVTNQSGIARGLYTEDDYRAVAARLDHVLTAAGALVDATLYCPHHPDFTGPCRCRKPGVALHRQAAEALDLDLARSYYVGDKVSDVLPAAELGGRGILVLTGHGRSEAERAPPGTWLVDDVTGAVDRILEVAGGAAGPGR